MREGDGKIGIFVIFVILSNRYRIYIYIYYELSESCRNEEDKYIHVRIPGGCTYTVVSNILARPRTSVNLTVDLVSDTLLPPKHR